jgi:hypothetical protein
MSMIFETNAPDGMRAMQYKFNKNGHVKMRVVGKGRLFTWSDNGTLAPNETPQEWITRMDKEGHWL